MSWIDQIADRFYYIGDCTTGLEDEQFCDFISDPTDMAQLVENSTPLKIDEFLRLTDLDEEHERIAHEGNTSFGYNPDRRVVWMYDNDNDIHYFFA